MWLCRVPDQSRKVATAMKREDSMTGHSVDSELMGQMAVLERVDFHSFRATIPLTLGMCLNNAGGGVAAGVANLNLYVVTAMVGVFSLSFFAGGYFGGQTVRAAATSVNIRSSYVNLAVGLLLIGMGVEQLVGS